MRTILIALAAGLLAAGASAQSMRFVSAGSGIYCHFNANCTVSPTTQSDTYAFTNVAATCVLESRSFAGDSIGSTGQYGYEYRLTLNNNGAMTTDTNTVTVTSLKLDFGAPSYFAFGGHASNQVWTVNAAGIDTNAAPSSADVAGNTVTFEFDPPLTLDASVAQSVTTCYFGLVSSNAPATTTAILIGSATDPVNGAVPFQTTLQTQAPSH
jgi:hypothetical protein